MLIFISSIYAQLARKQRKASVKRKEDRQWEDWDNYEKMSQDMGHTQSVERIPKRRRKPARNKHAHK